MNPPSLPEIECVCATVRRAARLVTQLYDNELRDRLPAAQFALLTAIGAHPGVSQKRIAEALAFDKTTMSRNLKLLEQKRWIRETSTSDQRERAFRTTTAGSQRLAAAWPAWTRAQQRLRDAMSAQEWTEIRAALTTLTAAAQRAGIPQGAGISGA